MAKVIVAGSKNDPWSLLCDLRNEAIERFQERYPNLDVEQVEIEKMEFYPKPLDLALPEEQAGEDYYEGDLVLCMDLVFMINNLKLLDMVELQKEGKVILMYSSNNSAMLNKMEFRAKFMDSLSLEIHEFVGGIPRLKVSFLSDGE